MNYEYKYEYHEFMEKEVVVTSIATTETMKK